MAYMTKCTLSEEMIFNRPLLYSVVINIKSILFLFYMSMNITDVIDIELLISLVEVRFVSWDKSLEPYKDRNGTTKACNFVVSYTFVYDGTKSA